MEFIFLIAIVLVPMIIGKAFLNIGFFKRNKAEFVENYLVGIFICLLGGEVMHLLALFHHWPLHYFSMGYALLIGCFFFFALFSILLKKSKKEDEKKKIQFSFRSSSNIWFIALGLLIILQGIYHIWMHCPDRSGDLILETVSTMVSTDTIYEINPMTGCPYEVGMPMRLKILALPSIYAALSSWFHIETINLIYTWIPTWVLVLAYLTMYEWAKYFYGDKEEKIRNFMFFFALLMQFGNYATTMLGYGIFHYGYRGEVFCFGVLYSYLLLMCFRRNWGIVSICLMVEIGLVWTFYGLGVGFFMSVLATVISFVYKHCKKEEKYE